MIKRFIKILPFLCFPIWIFCADKHPGNKLLPIPEVLDSGFSISGSLPTPPSFSTSVIAPESNLTLGVRTALNKRLSRSSSKEESSDESDELKRQRIRENSQSSSSASSSSSPGSVSLQDWLILPDINTTNVDTFWESFCPQEQNISGAPTLPQITLTADIAVRNHVDAFLAGLYQPEGTSITLLPHADHESMAASATQLTMPPQPPTHPTYHSTTPNNSVSGSVENYFGCGICEAVFPSRTLIDSHIRSHLPKKLQQKPSTYRNDSGKYECPVCKRTYDPPHSLRTHFYSHASDVTIAFFCNSSKCSKADYRKQFTSISGLFKHVKTVHGLTIPTGTTYPLTEEHSSPISGSIENPCGCNYPSCGQAFNNSKDLGTHFDLEHAKLEKPMPNDEGLFICKEPGCKHSPTKRRHYFKDHLRTKHFFAKPFRCNYPGCTQPLALERDLAPHLETAHSLKLKQNRGRSSGSSSRETRVGTSPMPTQPMPTVPSADPHSVSSSATSSSSSSATSSSVATDAIRVELPIAICALQTSKHIGATCKPLTRSDELEKSIKLV